MSNIRKLEARNDKKLTLAGPKGICSTRNGGGGKHGRGPLGG